MYPVSSTYKEAIDKFPQITQLSGLITLKDGRDIPVTNADILANSLFVEEQCVSGEDLEIGNVIMSALEVSLIIPLENPYLLVGAQISLSFGIDTGGDVWEWVPLGLFYVVQIERKEHSVSLVALDGLLLLDEPLGSTTTSGSSYEIISSCCATCGIPLGMVESEFDVFPNHAGPYTLPDNSKVETCRDLVMWVCQLLGCFARMNRIGQLELVALHGAPVKTYNRNWRYRTTKISDNEVKITQVTMPVASETYTVGMEGMTMTLEENPLLSEISPEDIIIILSEILGEITKAEYIPVEFSAPGDPSLQAGDYVKLDETSSLSGNPVCLVTHSKWRYRGQQTIRSVGKSALLRTEYSQVQKAISAVTKTAQEAHGVAQSATQEAFLLNSAIGGNILIRQESGGRNEILIMDSIDKDAAVKIWRFGINGWGYSDNCVGADNPERLYTIAATMDGTLTATAVSAAIGNFLHLVAGIPNSQRLVMGRDGDDPFLRIYNDNNVLQVTLDKNGMNFGENRDSRMIKYTIGGNSGIGLFVG